MELTPALTADLAVLTAAADDPDVDLEASVRGLADRVRRTVGSFLGVSFTVVVDGYPFTVTALDDPTSLPTIGASLRMSIPVRGPGPPASVLVFYAATPGAFVDLAADITHARRPSAGAVVLDADLQPPGDGLGWQLAGLSLIHQAVGVLIARGDTPEAARAELERRAVSGGVDVRTAAADVVASTAP